MLGLEPARRTDHSRYLCGSSRLGRPHRLLEGRQSAFLDRRLDQCSVALAALALSITNKNFGVALGLLLSISLFILFGYRYAVKTRKFMPSGLLAVVSLVVLAVMFLIMDWTQSRAASSRGTPAIHENARSPLTKPSP